MKKKIILKSILFLIVLFALDQALGFINEKIFYKQNHGDNGNTIEVLEKTKADILFFGSSRASHHFVSDSLEAVTHRTVFNAGRDNMGIHYVYALLEPLLNRYQPKVIVLDIMPNNYGLGGQDYKKYFDIQSSTLLPFAHKYPSIRKVVQDFAPNEALLSKISASYPFNSMIGTSFQNAYTHIGHIQIKGYEPLVDSIKPSLYKKPISLGPTTSDTIDEKAWNYLLKTVALCKSKNVKVIFTFSPYYFSTPTQPEIASRFYELVQRENIPLLDFTTNVTFTNNPNYFYDELHLNHTGAKELTRELAPTIINLLK